MTTFPAELDKIIDKAEGSGGNQVLEDENVLVSQVNKQLEELGSDPSLTQAVSILLKQSARAEIESRRVRLQQEKDLVEVVKVIKTQHNDIVSLKENSEVTDKAVSDLKDNHHSLEFRLQQVEFYINKSYYLACENRQRNSKGNFVLSGKHIPRPRTGENLIILVREMVFRKYHIDIHPSEFKVIHRLAGERILFALHNRLPGYGFDQLVRKMNSNPNPEVEVYASIQLFEPYSDLFYIARRLKYLKVISYYRLDENGYTYIALNERSKAFKFTNMNQLNQLNISVPQEIYDDLYKKRIKNVELDNQNAALNLKKAYEERPNLNSVSNVRQEELQSGNKQQLQSQTKNNSLETSRSGQSYTRQQQEVFHTPLTETAGQFTNTGEAATHGNFLSTPSGLVNTSSSNSQQTSYSQHLQPGSLQFRFPPPQGQRMSSKRGRSSSSSLSPTSTSKAVQAVHSERGFQHPISEKPRHSVRDVVQHYSNVPGVPYPYSNDSFAK